MQNKHLVNTMAVAKMTDEQFKIFIETIRSLAPSTNDNEKKNESKGSFGKCNVRFAGQCDIDAVEVFIDAIETYKAVEEISDADALKGLSLLFTGLAATWWKGVRREAKTWNDALRLLREHFSPTKPCYQIYLEIFEMKQGQNEPIDAYICKQRALLAKLPEGRHDEETQLDFIYGLLNLKYRQHIARYDIKTFRDLLEKGRNLEGTERKPPK